MRYVLQRGKPLRYLTHDDKGLHTWTNDVLDASRYESTRQAKEVKRSSTICTPDTKPHYVGLHGYYTLYRGYLNQIMREGKWWRVRYGLEKTNIYRTGSNQAESPKAAMRYGRKLIDAAIIVIDMDERTNGHRKAG